MSMAAVTQMSEAREKKRQAELPQVYSCGKCKEQAVMLMAKDHAIVCGRENPAKCTARMAADWYEPEEVTCFVTKPRRKLLRNFEKYSCGRCGYFYFHMQMDGTLTCYRERCKTVAQFRWRWHKDLSGAKG